MNTKDALLANIRPARAIYLDLNHWIELDKIKAAGDESPKKAILAALSEASRSGSAVFPVGAMHFMEIAKIGNAQQRESLAQLMTQLSGGWVLPSGASIVRREIEHAVRLVFSLPPAPPGKPVLRRGILSAFGELADDAMASVNPRVRPLLDAFTDTPEGWMSFLRQDDEAARRTTIEHMRRLSLPHIEEVERRRERLRKESKEIRYRVYCVMLFDGLQEHYLAAAWRLGIDRERFKTMTLEQAKGLIQHVPPLYVESELAVLSEQQWPRRSEQNDIYDVSALSAAIPYCDVVVTENFWAAISKQATFADRFQTRVLPNLQDLVAVLQPQPCNSN